MTNFVTIGGSQYAVYGTSAAFDAYEIAALGEGADAWLAALPVTRLKALVGAARLLDRQRWQGAPVGVPVPDLVLQWPRTGVVDAADLPVSSATVPAKIEYGAYELAASILADPSLMTSTGSGSNVRRAHAGDVAVEFFTSTFGVSGFFPQNVADLVGEFLDSGTGTGFSGSYATGTCEQSEFDDCDRYDVKGV